MKDEHKKQLKFSTIIALIFTVCVMILVTSGFIFFAYIGNGGKFFDPLIGWVGGFAFLCSIVSFPLVFEGVKHEVEN